uniref:Vesicle associated membrane protein 3 n=1 Tax=Ursus americanus TaxID=9643 RepID=A0A452R9D3_URSAM
MSLEPLLIAVGRISFSALVIKLLTARSWNNVFILTEMYLESEFPHACAFPRFRSTGAPAGPSAASGSSRRLQQTQTQVDEVVDIMRVNVDKVLERDQKLSELDDRADALQAGASQFETSAAKLKRKYWWKNCKMWAIGIVVVVVIIIIIIVWNVSP